jgi:cytidylate kinase
VPADQNTTPGLVIAVDGPSGSGKSSTARGVAHRLGLRYLDTGAMYRAVTWWMLRHHVDVHDPAAVASRCEEPRIESGTDPARPTIHVDGTDVATAIRTQDVTTAVSPVSAVPEVRRRLVDLQRKAIAAADTGIVVEGRDIGTVVCPDAPLKVFLTALGGRDEIDSGRAAAPLMKADDAVWLDTTELTLDEAIQAIIDLAEDRRRA